MFGYATRETPELMPMPILLAHKLCMRLAEVRRKEILEYLRPDGKSQVTIEYIDGKPARVDTVVISTQHSPEVTLKQIREDIIDTVILPVLPRIRGPREDHLPHQPHRPFVIGGPHGDTGSPGRKIIVDTYGGVGRHAAAPSRARTRPRWTARLPTWPATSPRIWWRGSVREVRGPAGLRHRRGRPGLGHGGQ